MHRTQHFPSDPTQVGAARRFVLDLLPDTYPRAFEAELCTSEVVTNAVVHPAPDRQHLGVDVTVNVADGKMVVTVTDGGGSKVPCVQRGQETQRVHGRGVGILDQLADEWGFTRGEDGTTQVWFTLLT